MLMVRTRIIVSRK